MDFQTTQPEQRGVFSEIEILAALRRYSAKTGGRPFLRAEFDRWDDRPFDARIAVNHFGSWRIALAAIGIKNYRGKGFSPAELIEDLERLWKEAGRAPSSSVVTKLGKFPLTAYVYRWYSLPWLCKRIARHHAGKLSRDRLLTPRNPRSLPSRVGTHVRMTVLQRDRFRCVLCGRSPANDPTTVLHVDHIIPALRGGKGILSNLRTLCRQCNHGRRDRPRRRGTHARERGPINQMRHSFPAPHAPTAPSPRSRRSPPAPRARAGTSPRSGPRRAAPRR